MKILHLLLVLCAAIIPYVAQGATTPVYKCSGALPVLYITTDSLKPVDSKENYLNATYYLDANGIEGVKPIASAELPDTLLIKGRGNATWTLPKKPYRLKLNKKAGLLGMPKSKHFVLLAHYDDYSGAYLMDETGFELSRRFRMAFTPQHLPVELVLNNEYAGLYFLTQNIRVSSERVNIVEQDDNDTIPENITGGWLLEKDNVKGENQIKTKFGRITYHSPEELSPLQSTYLNNYFSNLYDAVSVNDKTDTTWEEMIDIDTLARFYIINEILDDNEAFTGSCYMHKQRGDSTKLIFGPVWDFGRALHRCFDPGFHMLYENVPSYVDTTAVIELLKFPHLKKVIRQIWTSEIAQIRNGLDSTLLSWVDKLIIPCAAERKRWRGSVCYTPEKDAKVFIDCLNARMDWLDDIWNLNKLYDINNDKAVDIDDINTMVDVILHPETVTRKTTDITFDGPTDVDDLSKLIDKILYH